MLYKLYDPRRVSLVLTRKIIKEKVNKLAVSPLSRRPGNNHGFVLDGKYNRQEWATAQAPSESAVSGVSITTYNLAIIVCSRWSLVTNFGEVAKHSS